MADNHDVTVLLRLQGCRISAPAGSRRGVSAAGVAGPCRSPEWTAQQLVDALPEDSAPRYLLRDRDSIYDAQVRRRIASLGITEVVSSRSVPGRIHT
jgi:hypothetical protein